MSNRKDGKSHITDLSRISVSTAYKSKSQQEIDAAHITSKAPVEIPVLTVRQIAQFWAIADKCKLRHHRNLGDLCARCQSRWDDLFLSFTTHLTTERKSA